MRTLYISRNVTNAPEICSWFRVQGLRGVMDPASMHVTVAFSNLAVDWGKIPGPSPSGTLKVVGGRREMKVLGREESSKALVLGQERWEEVV